MVKHCLAAFNLIFLLNPSFEPTCAQNKSCRPSIPLQLLFWPNFGFQYEIWSFGQSNFDQNHFKRVQLGTVPFLFSLGSPSISAFASPRVTPASSSPLKRSPLPSRSPSSVSPTRFLPRVAYTAEPSNPSCRSPRRCRFRPPLAVVPRFLA